MPHHMIGACMTPALQAALLELHVRWGYKWQASSEALDGEDPTDVIRAEVPGTLVQHPATWEMIVHYQLGVLLGV